MTHTPGPWEARDSMFGQPRADGGFNPIGFVYCPAFPERSSVGKTAIADAFLIAAAPDLLDAVERLLQADDRQSRDIARAAILKATQIPF